MSDTAKALELLKQASYMIERATEQLERRAGTTNGSPSHGANGHPVVDSRALVVRWHGRECPLGATIPFRLLERLCRRPNWYVGHMDLVNDVWRGDSKAPETVRSTVRRLKRRLERGGMKRLAKAIRCEGGCYALVAERL